mmetsp:Transcript_9386/g.34426  ORF Transcript_9386/g.34426 Transcript_9386/m.34426 type:complete len:208 (+) Transcript_9386:45-668(+)
MHAYASGRSPRRGVHRRPDLDGVRYRLRPPARGVTTTTTATATVTAPAATACTRARPRRRRLQRAKPGQQMRVHLLRAVVVGAVPRARDPHEGHLAGGHVRLRGSAAAVARLRQLLEERAHVAIDGREGVLLAPQQQDGQVRGELGQQVLGPRPRVGGQDGDEDVQRRDLLGRRVDEVDQLRVDVGLVAVHRRQHLLHVLLGAVVVE